MRKQIASAVALLLNSSSAQDKTGRAPDSLQDDPNGLAGPAPCIDYMNIIGSGDIKSGDFHAVHGLQAKRDGGLLAAGSGIVGGGERGKDREAVIIKVMECPTQAKKYSNWSSE